MPSYDRVYVPEVEIWVSDENLGRLTNEDANRLAGLFREKAAERLVSRGWSLTSSPGDRVLTVRLALTELNAANQVGNIVTSLPYMTTQAIQLLAIVSDVNLFVGEVSTEVQIVDGVTGRILAEACDRRVGAHSIVNIGSTWGDVEDAMEIWVARLGRGLSKLNRD